MGEEGTGVKGGQAMQQNKFFPEIHGNFGFGCMRLPMNGGQVDYDGFTKMADAFTDAENARRYVPSI
mgnify:CR=1 FL=1